MYSVVYPLRTSPRCTNTQGRFTVTATQPIEYIVQEVPDLLDPSNPTLLQGVPAGPPCTTQGSLGVDGSMVGGYGGGRDAAHPLRRLVLVDSNVYRLYSSQLHEVCFCDGGGVVGLVGLMGLVGLVGLVLGG